MREVNWLGHVMFARAKVQLSIGRSNDFNKHGPLLTLYFAIFAK